MGLKGVQLGMVCVGGGWSWEVGVANGTYHLDCGVRYYVHGSFFLVADVYPVGDPDALTDSIVLSF